MTFDRDSTPPAVPAGKRRLQRAAGARLLVGRALGTIAWAALCGPIVGVVGCSSDTFACGSGTCAIGTEVCVLGDDGACSACIPAPAACSTCDCLPPATDDAFGDTRCVDAGTCQDVEDGAVVTCAEADGWGCG